MTRTHLILTATAAAFLAAAPDLPPVTMGIMPLPNGGAQFSLAMPL